MSRRSPSNDSVYVKGTSLVITGALVRTTVPRASRRLRTLPVSKLTEVDLTAVSRVDSSGLGLLEGLRDGLFGASLELRNAPPPVAEMIDTFAGEQLAASVPQRSRFRIRDVRHMVIYVAAEFWEALSLSGEIFYWSVVNVFRRSGHREGEVAEQVNTIGLNAIPIVATLSFVIGVILALQSAVQLERFGGGPFLADLMGLAMVREMGPLLTAIIVTGRSGSAIASELGTMKVTDEIDALRAMGIRPVEYVIVPKFIAFTIVSPLLAVLSATVGLLGGLMISVSFAGQPAQFFINRAMNVLGADDVAFLLLKGLLFGWAIVMVSCYHGFGVRGGAIEVGHATTQAVVASISAIVLLNVVFSMWYIL